MRAPPRRRGMLCLAAVLLVAAAPTAQSRESRVEAATRVTTSLFEEWLGPIPAASQTLTLAPSRSSSPFTMDLESQVAWQLARRYWAQQPPTVLMDGAARYLQHRAVERMFDLSFGRAGAGVETVILFGGSYTRAFPNLRFDGAAAAGRDQMSSPPARAALAFASLERIVGEPRLLGALRSVIDAAPGSDAAMLSSLQAALGQDVAWLFEAAIDPVKSMNYRIAGVGVETCAPAPCHRVRVELAHEGDGEFRGVEVRVDFSDGQSPSVRWDGHDRSRAFTFEGPSDPVRVRVDPDLVNLLDDNLLDQSKELRSTTNAPIAKWIARWTVWLQDAMLTYSAVL